MKRKNMSNHLENMDVDELQSYLSDFHKDFYGFRPRSYSNEDWNNKEFLIRCIDGIHKNMDDMKETPEGRASLRADGWVIDEKEFV